MKNFNSKIYLSIFIIFDLIFIVIIACFFSGLFPDRSLAQKERTHLIGASYMTMKNEFFRIISEAISSRIEAERDQIVVRDPSLNVERQINQIDEMIDMGIDVLIVNPVDWKSLTSILKKARENGVETIAVDSNVADEELIESTITSDNYRAGQLIGEFFLSENDKADLVLMTHNSAKSGRDRIQEFMDTIKKNPNINIIKQIDCEGQTEIAMPKLKKFIKTGAEFDSVFCLNDLASIGVVAALLKSRKFSDLMV